VSRRSDNFAFAIILIALLFFAVVLGGPFSHGLLAGAIVCVVYGHYSHQHDLIAIGAFIPLFALSRYINSLVVAVTPHTIDAALMRIDFGIGIRAFKWTLSHPLLWWFLSVVYIAIGLVAAFPLCFTDRRSELVRALVIASLLAPFFYWVFPAVGPAWIHDPTAPRNCIPSLHLSWAFLLWIYAGKPLRTPMLIFVVLTAAATLCLGEHYMIDLVAAVPFTAAACALARKLADLPAFVEKITGRPWKGIASSNQPYLPPEATGADKCANPSQCKGPSSL
jgi:hypothetical protein